MGTLADCLRKTGLSAQETKYVTDTVKLYRQEGFPAKEARLKAVRDIVRDTRRQQRSVVEQINRELERRRDPEQKLADTIVSLANRDKEKYPTLTADDFRQQVRAAALKPEEGEGIIALAEANAEYRGETLDQWLQHAVAGVEQTDPQNSAYAKQFSGAKNRKVRGETQILEDGRAIIRAFKGSQNLATLAHELWHVFRRTLLPEDLARAERALGIKKWTRYGVRERGGKFDVFDADTKRSKIKFDSMDAAREWISKNMPDERFARYGERYLREGKAPTPELQGVFERFKSWLTNIYRNLSNGPLADEIPAELRDVFDRSLGKTDAQVAEEGGDAREIRGTADEGNAVREGSDGGDAVQQATAEPVAENAPETFQLTRPEPTRPAAKFESTPTSQPDLIPDLWRDSLPGQQGLFEGEQTPPPPPEPPLAQSSPIPATPDFPTGVKNAVTEADRVALGKPPRVRPEPEARSQWDQDALATLYRNPQAGQQIVDEILAQGPYRQGDTLYDTRPVSKREVFVVANHKTKLLNEQKEVGRQISDAYDAGDQQAILDLQARFDALTDQLYATNLAMEKTGTEQSHAFSARGALKNADYSLDRLEYRLRGANGGRPLTDGEQADVRRISTRAAELEAEIEEGQRKTQQKAFEKGMDNLRKRARSEKKDSWTPSDLDLDYESDAVDISNAAKKLAKYFFNKDIIDREDNLQAVHDTLKPYLWEAWSLEDTRQAISDYGNVKKLSKEPVDQWFRQLRGEHQKVGKLRDMLAGRPPKITGTEREPPNQENRDLTKKVNEYKRRYNIQSGDDATNARSALDAVKTRLRNEIADLEKQIRERTKIIKRKSAVQYDDKANELKAKRDALKVKFDEIFGKPEMTDEQRIQLAMRAMERNIGELERRINEGDFSVTTPRVYDSPAYVALKAKQQAVRAEYEVLREYDPAYQESQRQKRLSVVEGQIAEYERQIRENDFPATRQRAAVDLDLQQAQAVREALRTKRNEVRKTDPEWMREQQRKDVLRIQARISKRMEQLADRMGREDYLTKPADRKHGPYGEQTTRAMDELAKLHKEFDDKVYDANLKVSLESDIQKLEREMKTLKFDQKPPREVRPISPEVRQLKIKRDILRQQRDNKKADQERTIIGKLYQGTGLLRLVQTTGEMSFIARQGGKQLFASIGGLPVGDTQTIRNFGRAVRESFKALASEKYAKASDERMFNSPFLEAHEAGGLRVIYEGEHISGSEEVRVGGIASQIPGLKNFERAARVFYNELRTGAFDAMVVSAGRELTPQQLKALGYFVNVSTGYGSLGSIGQAAEVFNEVFYSPRNLAASFQYLSFHPWWNKNAAGVRSLIVKQYVKTFTGMAVAYGLAALAGADIELDPRSADFMKWRFGNTRIDPLTGLAQIMVLGARVATGKQKNQSGKLTPVDSEVFWRFARNKFSPHLGLAMDLTFGKDPVGERVTLGNIASRGGPITYFDIGKAMQEQGIPQGAALGILGFFGMGLATYQERRKPLTREQELRRMGRRTSRR